MCAWLGSTVLLNFQPRDYFHVKIALVDVCVCVRKSIVDLRADYIKFSKLLITEKRFSSENVIPVYFPET